MAAVIELKAKARPRGGKGSARQVRREGLVPAVIYGDAKSPETIALDYNELWKLLLKGRFTKSVITVQLDGTPHRVLPREVQLDPVKDFPIHVDFQRISSDGRIRIAVPVRFINEGLSPGLKRGGVLNIVRREIEVTCPADRIPEAFEINLEGLEIGRSVHISSVKLPDGVKPTIINRDFTIATIAGAVKEEVVETPDAAAAAAVAGAAPVAGAPAPAADGKAAPAAAAAGKGGDAAKAPAGGDKKKQDR